jgi:hypothetical protein
MGLNFGVANVTQGVLVVGLSSRTIISNCVIDGWPTAIGIAPSAGANIAAHINGCTIVSQNFLYPATGVNGIVVTNTGSKASVMNTHITGYATGVNIQTGAGGAATVVGCYLSGNTAQVNLTGTATPYTAGNY